MIENTIPVLPVADVAASFTFYVSTLDFVEQWRSPNVGSVGRDGHPIMLQSSETPGVSRVWIGCEDALALFKQFKARGVKVVMPPTNQGHALEMMIADPDGNVLWFGSEPLTDVPIGEVVPVN